MASTVGEGRPLPDIQVPESAAGEGDATAGSEMSNPSTGKRRTRRRRITKPKVGLAECVNIEDVYTTISDVVASDLNPPPSRVVLSPRSAEACLKQGVNPEVLKIRDLDSFYEPDIDPAVQRLRHEAYSMRRHEVMREVRTERKRIINAEIRNGDGAVSGGGGGGALTAEQMLAAQEQANSTLVENERKRMEKMRRRQEKELEQMLQFETKMGEVEEEMNRRAEKQKQKEDARQRAKQKRMREMAAERYKRDLRRKAQEDAEEEQRARLAAEYFRKEQERIDEEKAQEKRNKKLARLRDEERKRKRLEHQLATKRLLDEQQRKIKERMVEMELATARREEAMAKKRVEDAIKLKERRDAIEHRIQRNLRMAEKVEAKRKADFFERQAYHDKLRHDADVQKSQERALMREQQELRTQQRRLILAKIRDDEEKLKETLTQRIQDEEINVIRVKELREREHKLVHERVKLKKQLKMENVERIRRVKEYKKLETMRKIQSHNSRVEEMLRKRKDIIAQRKQLALQSKIQKDSIVEVINKAKSNGTQATKLLQKLIAGGGDVEGTTTKRKKKKGRRKKKGDMLSRAESQPQLRSRTAGYADEDEDGLGPMPDAPSLHAAKAAGQQPRPYISPYDA
eukprot:CAMPEP_0118865890 /NCGR_PEP_ID=MMETSP1163-20130328/9997_1 /TAXON_ID=124430 /ORGANISM="Phaeomonas parva, Strain CCMP2877" /LENGTH=629 /DNA_ID=CAMNT_0006800157 /DNA_START=253 /DNA_END=2142 /DNA_ORIENTATION=+